MLQSVNQSNDKVMVSSQIKLVEEISYVKNNDTPLVLAVMTAMQVAINGETPLPREVLSMQGMSGWRYRIFINELVRQVANPAYLEVGSWAGSTLCSAIYGNTLSAMAIDNWSEFGGPSQIFFTQVSKYVSSNIRLSILNSDFRQVRWDAIGKYNIYLFDGPHSIEDQCDGIVIAMPALTDSFIVIVDDWNYEHIRNGTYEALNKVSANCDLRIEIRTTLNGEQPTINMEKSEWHDGYFIAVCRKNGK
jgi:hypothetical protein